MAIMSWRKPFCPPPVSLRRTLLLDQILHDPLYKFVLFVDLPLTPGLLSVQDQLEVAQLGKSERLTSDFFPVVFLQDKV